MELVNKLVEMANSQAKELKFVGKSIKKLDKESAEKMGIVQDKLAEVKSYILAIKEATDARDKYKDEEQPTTAVVQSWLEVSQ